VSESGCGTTEITPTGALAALFDHFDEVGRLIGVAASTTD
jgi:hypothetical protein